MTLDELIAAIMRLPPEDLARLHRALNSAHAAAPNAVRESAAPYLSEPHGESMTQVTVALPDELVEKAKNAGLLGGRALEELLHRALQTHPEAATSTSPQYRRLVEKNGYLVAEAMPGEQPITTEEVKKILDDMEW